MTLVFLSLSMAACAPKASPTIQDDQPLQGDRTFKMDSAKPIVAVSVYGAMMGTPDAGTIEAYMQEAESEGLVTNVRQGLYGIEGGFIFCAEPSSEENLETLFADLQGIPTDPQQTHFQALSLDICPF